MDHGHYIDELKRILNVRDYDYFDSIGKILYSLEKLTLVVTKTRLKKPTKLHYSIHFAEYVKGVVSVPV